MARGDRWQAAGIGGGRGAVGAIGCAAAVRSGAGAVGGVRGVGYAVDEIAAEPGGERMGAAGGAFAAVESAEDSGSWVRDCGAGGEDCEGAGGCAGGGRDSGAVGGGGIGGYGV